MRKLLIYLFVIIFFSSIIVFSQHSESNNWTKYQGTRDTTILISKTQLSLLKDILKDTVKLKLIASSNIQPHSYSLIDKDAQEFVLNTYSAQLILITIIITIMGIGIGVLQWYMTKRNILDINNKWSQTKEEWNNKIISLTQKLVRELFEGKYSKEIFENTKRYSEEAMMNNPDLRGTTASRIRRFQNEFLYEFIKKTHGKKDSVKFINNLGSVIQDWFVFGQLCSLDTIELQQGLISFISMPFQEAQSRLATLKVRYADNNEIYPLVLDAIRSIENQRANEIATTNIEV
jgi:hypothetical protein